MASKKTLSFLAVVVNLNIVSNFSVSLMRKKTEFKKIFEDHWERFKQKHPVYNGVFYDQAVEKMLGCGDAKNGYTEYRCTTCGVDIRRVPFTCKSPFCLSCGKVYSDSVVTQVSKILHPGVT